MGIRHFSWKVINGVIFGYGRIATTANNNRLVLKSRGVQRIDYVNHLFEAI